MVNIKKLVEIFEKYPEIKLAYFFGSRAEGKAGKLSDFDFAFYLDENNTERIFDIKFELIDKISRLLQTDAVDVIILNIVENSELKYNIIKDGKLIYEKEPFKVLIEPRILNEYFDFNMSLKKYGLTKA